MKKIFCRLVLLLVWTVLCAESRAAEIKAEIGRFGEIPNWLILKVSDIPMDQDPLAPVGGEPKYAAMEDLKWVPNFNAPLEIPDGKGGKTRIGDGVWEATRMVMPDMPGIWNEYPRLVVPDGHMYAYCRLDSPTNRTASLITGLRRNGGKCRVFLNGNEVGVVEGGFGFENAYELPIELKTCRSGTCSGTAST